ncbi:hypothetical protein [Ornithinibacillus sp. JPR2-1]|uniref:hypothetical protein n=1 Tax=Ornithinibacillus sp. JPR2-1 TaxID=2094019 RepID=UPI0031DA77AD
MYKIIGIESARPMDGTYWKVGEKLYIDGEPKEVTEIKDLTSEFPDSIDRQYDIYVEGKLYQSLVNMPVIITYDTESRKEV